ncbi:MAG: hypothetical protein ACI4XO_06930, partial [Akkermansia sp.]
NVRIGSFWADSSLQAALAWLPFLFIGWFSAAACIQRRIGDFAMLLISLGFALAFDVRYTGILVVSLLLSVLICRFTDRAAACLSALGLMSAYMWLNHRLIFGYWFADLCYSCPPPNKLCNCYTSFLHIGTAHACKH